MARYSLAAPESHRATRTTAGRRDRGDERKRDQRRNHTGRHRPRRCPAWGFPLCVQVARGRGPAESLDVHDLVAGSDDVRQLKPRVHRSGGEAAVQAQVTGLACRWRCISSAGLTRTAGTTRACRAGRWSSNASAFCSRIWITRRGGTPSVVSGLLLRCRRMLQQAKTWQRFCSPIPRPCQSMSSNGSAPTFCTALVRRTAGADGKSLSAESIVLPIAGPMRAGGAARRGRWGS